MMLFSKSCHKLSSTLFSQLTLPLIVLITCFLTSCSLVGDSTSADNNTTSNREKPVDIKTIGKNIIELGDIPKGELKKDLKASMPEQAQTDNDVADPVNSDEKTQYQTFLAQQVLLKAQLPNNIHTLYQASLTQMKNKNWQGALVLLNDVIQQYPNLSAAYLNKALALYQLKQLDEAVSTLKQAEKINAINPYVYNLQGVLAREHGKFDEAEKYYQQALAIWPDYPEAHLNIAVLFELYRGKFIQAKAHYKAYIALKPDDIKTQKWLAGLEIKLASRKDS